MSKRGQLEAQQNYGAEQTDPSLLIDPNMKHFCSQITETVGKPAELSYIENQKVLINQEDQAMLSEEEEEEDSQSEDNTNQLDVERAEQIGQHLTGEDRTIVHVQSPVNCLDQLPPSSQEQSAGHPKIFSGSGGSNEEWTDKRIREFQEHIEINRKGLKPPD